MPIGLMLWLRITGKDPIFVHSNISHRTPASFTDHLKSSAVITFLQSSWSSRMHGIDSVCAPHTHTHTKSTHSSECSERICMPATFVCYLLNCPQWLISHVYIVWILATFLLFLNAAGLPASFETGRTSFTQQIFKSFMPINQPWGLSFRCWFRYFVKELNARLLPKLRH